MSNMKHLIIIISFQAITRITNMTIVVTNSMILTKIIKTKSNLMKVSKNWAIISQTLVKTLDLDIAQ
jgi:hypothetical protein